MPGVDSHLARSSNSQMAYNSLFPPTNRSGRKVGDLAAQLSLLSGLSIDVLRVDLRVSRSDSVPIREDVDDSGTKGTGLERTVGGASSDETNRTCAMQTARDREFAGRHDGAVVRIVPVGGDMMTGRIFEQHDNRTFGIIGVADVVERVQNAALVAMPRKTWIVPVKIGLPKLGFRNQRFCGVGHLAHRSIRAMLGQ